MACEYRDLPVVYKICFSFSFFYPFFPETGREGCGAGSVTGENGRMRERGGGGQEFKKNNPKTDPHHGFTGIRSRWPPFPQVSDRPYPRFLNPYLYGIGRVIDQHATQRADPGSD
jgi:hypothetical protein